MRIAIVGSGIAGLVAAYRLHARHDITLFESQAHLGGHAHTIDVPVGGRTFAIDVGFIVFNDWTYPRFKSLLEELAVPSRPTVMSFSVRDDCTGLEYNGHSLNSLFAQRRNLFNPRFARMIADVLRFNRQARRLVADADEGLTVGEFLARHRYSDAFAEQYLLPMGASIWSCPTGTFAEFPIRFIVDFYYNHGLLNILHRPTWRVVQGGSRTYVGALSQSFRHRVQLQTPIVRVTRSADAVEVCTRSGKSESFDHVIFACHSDQALQILGGDSTPVENELLSAFPYGRNVAVLHTDDSLLPRNRRAWASWNYRLSEDRQAPPSVTYNMNLLQGFEAPQTFCLTLNDVSRIAPEKILRRFEYQHPVFTTRRAAAQARRGELVNANRTSFCGAYWKNGFHEDGVTSALAVVDAIQSGRPDRKLTCTGAPA